jgi:hypothetical protein
MTHFYRQRVSNRLAALAVFLLVAASLATGFDRSMDSPLNAGQSVAGNSSSVLDRGQASEVKAKRNFKVRLYLFRRN